ncbi:hypothetical protein MBLNU459_g6955t1 [Dothideomycetes sp. NU459]
MGREDQLEEREVLDSIFPDEITDISETDYRVSIQLDVTPDDEADPGEAPTILLQVHYPEAYPDEPPRLDLSYPPNAARYPHLDIQADKAALLQSLAPTVDENLGMAMIFTVVTTVKELAEQLVGERQAAIAAVREARAAEAEAEENRKFEGTKVTRDTFLDWSARFKEDMADARRRAEEAKEIEDKKKRGPKEERKMTGRELWEKGLAGKVEDEDEGVDIMESMQTLKVEG